MSTSLPAEDRTQPPGVGPPLVAYVVALFAYVALGFFLKSVLLNWIVGPLFLLLVLHLLPRLLGARRSSRSKSAG